MDHDLCRVEQIPELGHEAAAFHRNKDITE